MTNKKKMNMDELEKVIGGWDHSLLTEEEKEKLIELQNQFTKARDAGKPMEAYLQLQEYLLELGQKYGWECGNV